MSEEEITEQRLIAYCIMLCNANAELYVEEEEALERFKGMSKRLEKLK